MSKAKEIIACIIALLILAFTIKSVYADTSVITDPNDLPGLYSTGNNNTGNNNAGFSQITATNNNTNNDTGTTSPNTTNTNNSNKNNANNTSVPYTGINNTSIFFIIGICGVSAIFAYKKIRDYNIK